MEFGFKRSKLSLLESDDRGNNLEESSRPWHQPQQKSVVDVFHGMSDDDAELAVSFCDFF